MTTQLGRTLFLLLVSAVLFACGGGSGGSSAPAANSPPVAAFTATPTSGAAPLTVQFDASASSDADGTVADYRWEFGDGTAAGTGRTTGHVFQTAGTFTVTLTVTDNRGATAATTRTVSATSVPTIVAVPSVVGLTQSAATSAITAAGLTVGTVASASSDTIAAGSVASQSPAGGSLVNPGSAVNLVISTGPGGGTAAIQAWIVKPTARALVPDPVLIEVALKSTFEITSAIASMAGREVRLAPPAPNDIYRCFGYGGMPCLIGSLSLSGVPVGTYLLNVRLADSHGNVLDTAVSVTFDSPPQLTWVAPLEYSVALPTLPVDLRCSDDRAGCVVELYVGSDWMNAGTLLMSGSGGVSGTVDLTPWIGKKIYFTVRARDVAGQAARPLSFAVFVESPARLTAVAELPGLIQDADATRVLQLEKTSDGERLEIYSRATMLTERIALPPGIQVHDGWAYLTPDGAIFEANSNGDWGVYLWRNGALSLISTASVDFSTLRVRGPYAIWNRGWNLYRVDTRSGTAQLVTANAVHGDSVASDGTAVFSNMAQQIVRDRAGVQTVLSSDTADERLYPVTDGNNVVYAKSLAGERSLVLLTDGTSVRLTSGSIAYDYIRSPPDKYYQVENGWVAYTEAGNLGQWQVFTRSPSGATTRQTDLGTSSTIDRLAGNGELMILNGTQRYFSRGAGLLPVSSTNGRSYWIDGSWYLGIGRALLQVNTGP